MNEELTQSPIGEKLTKTSEGLMLHAYPDPATNGEPYTIGYGHTDPGHIKLGDTCTEAQADAWYEHDKLGAEAIIKNAVTVQLTQGQFDALVDFVYMEGPGAPGVKDGFVWLANGNHSTLLRKINSGDFVGAAAQFILWDTNAPPGQRTRHLRQTQLFKTGSWS